MPIKTFVMGLLIWISSFPAFAANITEQEFKNILAEVEAIYSPVVAQLGARLLFVNNWSDDSVDSMALRMGATWQVHINGGLARHSAITLDGLALVACHEIGHHLAGDPRYAGLWSSVEGQSDYFAAAKCLRKLWTGKNNTGIFEDPKARIACRTLWSVATEQDLCVRVVMAGKSVSEFARAQAGTGTAASLDTPDLSNPTSVLEGFPSYQCRLDTFLRGALCNVSADSMTSVCSQPTNNRAACWFPGGGSQTPFPPVTPTPTPTPPVTPTPTPPVTPTPTPPVTPTPTPPVTPTPTPPVTPTPTPTPPAGVAKQPLLNGQYNFKTSLPSKAIIVQMDTGFFAKATHVLLEISKPNTPFANPNGTSRDPNALRTLIFPVGDSTYLIPRRDLNGQGAYELRILPIDASGVAVGRFSNPSQLVLE